LVLQGKPIMEYPPQAVPTWDYTVSVTRACNPARHEYYVATLKEFLPRFRLPLGNNDRDLVVDLQGVFAGCLYDAGFSAMIDYTREPAVPVEEENRRWLAEILKRSQGLPLERSPRATGKEWLEQLTFVAGDAAEDFADSTIEQTIRQYNQIKETAYRIWLEEGCPHGRDAEHWQ